MYGYLEKGIAITNRLDMLIKPFSAPAASRSCLRVVHLGEWST